LIGSRYTFARETQPSTRDTHLNVSVIIPCYNEKETIYQILDAVRDGGCATEIVVVEDGSTDGTREMLKELAPDPMVRIIYHDYNQGKGAAVRTGFSAAQGDVFIIQDADLEYDPREYPSLLKPIQEGRSKVVYGSRFLGGPRKTMFFWNMVANRTLTFITNILYNTILSDMETCYKVFKAEVVRDLMLRSHRFEFEPEITAKVLKQGYRIYEVPISYNGREWEEGKKIKWYDFPIAAWTLIRYRFTD
jgi:glycosyltransferase involved in cell wall biosynthesis